MRLVVVRYLDRQMSNSELPITELLNRFGNGDQGAEKELFPYLYAELRKLAFAKLRRERAGHTLQATALVHEVYLRMIGHKAQWNGRAHFFAVSARVMRAILIDYARQQKTGKRGGGIKPLPLDDVLIISSDKAELALQVDEALVQLAALDERQARVVEMRYFAGMTEEEIGLVLGVSSKTVKRDWAMAKAWLATTLSSGEGLRT